MTYQKIGTIDSISEIEFDKKIIVSGHVNKIGWMWRMPGIFKQQGKEIFFENEHGMKSKVVEGEIGLNILRTS